MFVENAYPNDTRVKNEADTLTAAGYSVIVVALRRHGQPLSERVDCVEVYRLPRLELFQKTRCEKLNFVSRAWLKSEISCRLYQRICLFFDRMPRDEHLRCV